MSRRKYFKEWKYKAPRVVCPGEPAQAVIGVREPARSDGGRAELQAAVREAAKAVESKVDAAIDQVRADAQALETAATLLRDAPGYPVPHTAETIEALRAMATGMRLAADRMPDSRDIPF